MIEDQTKEQTKKQKLNELSEIFSAAALRKLEEMKMERAS
jgi:hypothetical protein